MQEKFHREKKFGVTQSFSVTSVLPVQENKINTEILGRTIIIISLPLTCTRARKISR